MSITERQLKPRIIGFGIISLLLSSYYILIGNSILTALFYFAGFVFSFFLFGNPGLLLAKGYREVEEKVYALKNINYLYATFVILTFIIVTYLDAQS